jgi:hypothetical protein
MSTDPAAKFAHAIVSLGAQEEGAFTREDLAGELTAFDWVDALEEPDGKVSVNELALAMRHLEIHEPGAAQALRQGMERLQKHLAGLAALITAIGFGVTAAGWALGVSLALWVHAKGSPIGGWVGAFLVGYFGGRIAMHVALLYPANRLRERVAAAKAAMLDELNSAFAKLPGAS